MAELLTQGRITINEVYLGRQKGAVRRRELIPDGYTVFMPDEEKPGTNRLVAVYGDTPKEGEEIIPTTDDPTRKVVSNQGGIKKDNPFWADIRARRAIWRAAKKEDGREKIREVINFFTGKR